jgi:hypothetical protein
VLVDLLLAATLTASPKVPPIPEGPQPMALPRYSAVPPGLVLPPKVVPVQPRPAGAIYNPASEPGAGLRRYGLASTIAGVILGLGGVIAATTNPCGQDGANGSDCVSDTRNAVAMAMGAGSFGLITGGVVAMSVGHAQQRRARLELAGFGVTLHGGGLQLRARF